MPFKYTRFVPAGEYFISNELVPNPAYTNNGHEFSIIVYRCDRQKRNYGISDVIVPVRHGNFKAAVDFADHVCKIYKDVNLDINRFLLFEEDIENKVGAYICQNETKIEGVIHFSQANGFFTVERLDIDSEVVSDADIDSSRFDSASDILADPKFINLLNKDGETAYGYAEWYNMVEADRENWMMSRLDAYHKSQGSWTEVANFLSGCIRSEIRKKD